MKRFNDVKNRFLIFGASAIVLLSVLNFFTSYLINQYLTNEFVNKYLETESVQLLNLKVEVENTLFELSTNENAIEDSKKDKVLEGLSEHVKKREAVYAVLLRPDGQIIEYTHPQKYEELKPIENRTILEDSESKNLLNKTPIINSFVDDKTFQKFYEMRIPIISGKENKGIIKVFISQKDILKRLNPMLTHINDMMITASLVGGIIFLFIGLVIFYLLHSTRILQSQIDEEKHFAEIGSIAAGMAHEIKNPLNAIGMNLQMIDSKIQENNKSELIDYVQHKIKNALNESKRLESLLNGFLHYSKQDETIEDVDIESVIGECIELLRVEADAKKILLLTNGSYKEPLKLGRGKIKQVFINLILNAIQNTDSGYIEIKLQANEANNGAIIRVIDTGKGIKKEDQSKIFNMFFTTRKNGTGLGLHVAKALLEEFHGKIKLEKSDHTGTTFLIEIPKRA